MLDDRALDLVVTHGEERELAPQQPLVEANTPIKEVCFPITAVISILASYDDGTMIEMATIGREGFTNASALLGGSISPSTQIAQMPGSALFLTRADFDNLIADEPAFRSLLERYTDTFLYQVMISAACNGAHAIEQRLARWLLMMLDRSDMNTVDLTHEFLAHVLNVRRASVTTALSHLEESEAVARERGRIVVTDRSKLADASCECYQLVSDYRAQTVRAHIS